MSIDSVAIRPIKEHEYKVLDNFLYEAIFVPAGAEKPPRGIINKPDLQVYVKDFGKFKDDHAMVIEDNGKIVGACWARIMDDYGHIDNQTPSIAISLYEDYRGHGLGAKLTIALLKLLKGYGYGRASLSVQKTNHHAIEMYQKVGFKTIGENDEEYLMAYDLRSEKICQSCGMPITSNDQLGTEKDGSTNSDYCKYCYENGEFIDKVSMEEYIDMCSQYGEQAGMTNEEMKKHCEKLFPTLKRWKQNNL